MKHSALAAAVVALALSELAIPMPIRADTTTFPCSLPRQLSHTTILAGPTAAPTPPPRVQMHPVLAGAAGPASPTPTPIVRFIKAPISCVPAILTVTSQAMAISMGLNACLTNVIDMSLSMTADGPPFWPGHQTPKSASMPCQATFTQLPKGVPLYYKLAWANPVGRFAADPARCDNPVTVKGTFTIPSSFPSNSSTPYSPPSFWLTCRL